MTMDNKDVIQATVEIVKAAIANPNSKINNISKDYDTLIADLIETVYKKIAELSKI